MALQVTEAADFYLDKMHEMAPGTLVEVVLFNGDLDIDGEELDVTECPGYTAFVIADWATFWLPSAAGLKTSNLFNFADATDAWQDVARFEGLRVDGVVWDCMPLQRAIRPTVAGPFEPVQITRRF